MVNRRPNIVWGWDTDPGSPVGDRVSISCGSIEFPLLCPFNVSPPPSKDDHHCHCNRFRSTVIRDAITRWVVSTTRRVPVRHLSRLLLSERDTRGGWFSTGMVRVGGRKVVSTVLFDVGWWECVEAVRYFSLRFHRQAALVLFGRKIRVKNGFYPWTNSLF